MAEKKRKSGKMQDSYNKRMMHPNVKDEIWAIVIIAAGVFLVVAFQTHAAGTVGKGLSSFFKGCLGIMAYVLPYYLIMYGILLFARKMVHVGKMSAILLFVILLMASIMNSARFIDADSLDFSLQGAGEFYRQGSILECGGLFGMYTGSLLVKAFGVPGLYIISILIVVICLLLIINTPVSRFFEKAAQKRRERKETRLAWEEVEDTEELQEPDTVPVVYGNAIFEDDEETGLQETPLRFFKFFRKRRAEHPVKAEPLQDEEYIQLSEMGDFEVRRTPDERSYRPIKISNSQRHILEYMEDDELFSSSPAPGPAFGLEDPADDASIDRDPFQEIFPGSLEDPAAGTAVSPPVQSYGLDPDVDFNTGTPEPGSQTQRKNQHHEFENEAAREDAGLDTFPHGMSDAVSEMQDTVPQVPEKLTNSQAKAAYPDVPDPTGNAIPAAVYKFPPVDLLKKGKAPRDKVGLNVALQQKAMKLEETLKNFNIDAEVVQVIQGPAVTRYEIHPNVGVKVKSIVNLADDIALNLEAKSIRIEAPIPGKAAVGIEVENDQVNMVTIREIIDSKEFKSAKSRITFTVGKDIAGNAIVADLKGMPHLLIAGSTGSGKSVCVNSIITSILYKARPEEVKLVLIDPKVVELTNYNGIPHLLIPVVTEPAKAAAALNWAVAEMEDRYKKFAKEGVRELSGYNETVMARGEEEEFLPQVIIIIDELADLMMAAPSQVEESICRLAQKARAAGMHLILATQRPSVNVITGVIKANVPSRIAFAVSSQFDSRTILDMAGAEKLVGKGDMLFSPIGGGKPVRVQGTFISDSEVHDVIEFVKGQVQEAEYADDVIHTIDKAGTPQTAEDTDELLPEAIDTVVSAGQASVSMLQRRFRIGYNRAARIVEMMEARGIVGPQEGSRPRQVLMTEAELQALHEDTEDLQEG